MKKLKAWFLAWREKRAAEEVERNRRQLFLRMLAASAGGVTAARRDGTVG